MYITEVITSAKSLYPSEYSLKEYLRWCDELSADIKRNYDITYNLLESTNGTAILPEGVTINDISRIVADGAELRKTDIRDAGYICEYGERGRVYKETGEAPKNLKIYYAVPYTPIRYVDEDVSLTFMPHGFSGGIIDLREGDFIKITIDNTEYKGVVDGFDGESYKFTGDTLPQGTFMAHIYREIMEKTEMPAPYDTAYIDFVNAKAAFYEGDKNAYASFMSQFNSKFKEYSNYITRNKPRVKSKFYNWY